MKNKMWILAIAALAVVGCGGSMKDKLVGSWKVDPTSFSGKFVDQAKSAGKLDELTKGSESTRFKFNADGKFEISMGGHAAPVGSWSLKDHEITISPADSAGGKNQPETATLNADGSRIRMSEGQQGISFELVKA